jgi:hypothetical protein
MLPPRAEAWPHQARHQRVMPAGLRYARPLYGSVPSCNQRSMDVPGPYVPVIYHWCDAIRTTSKFMLRMRCLSQAALCCVMLSNGPNCVCADRLLKVLGVCRSVKQCMHVTTHILQRCRRCTEICACVTESVLRGSYSRPSNMIPGIIR